MPLRIVIDARRIRDFGIGTYIRSLTHALAGLDTTHRYILVTSADDCRTVAGLPPNFESAAFGGKDQEYKDHFAFPMFLRGLRPNLVHLPVNHVPLLMPKPYVVTVHDMADLMFQDWSGWRRGLERFQMQYGLMRANRIIAVSDATRRDLENLLRIPAERVRLVYNAPDPEFFTHPCAADARAAGPDAPRLERQRILERYQIHYPFLLYAGNIRPQKNIPRLVEAFRMVMEDFKEHPVWRSLRLIIIGDEISKNPSVRQAVIKSRVEDSVRFLGFVPFDTLRCFYESAAAFVFPSLYEGFGLPPLEAMASGTPVVTSSISSLPEVAGDAAVLVNPENVFDIKRGICAVLSDENLRRELICRGREHAARYSWERTAKQVLEIYHQVARKK